MLEKLMRQVEQEVRNKDSRITEILSHMSESTGKTHLAIGVALKDRNKVQVPLSISKKDFDDNNIQSIVYSILLTVDHAVWGPRDYSQVQTTAITA